MVNNVVLKAVHLITNKVTMLLAVSIVNILKFQMMNITSVRKANKQLNQVYLIIKKSLIQNVKVWVTEVPFS